jgi:hypothetical protein
VDPDIVRGCLFTLGIYLAIGSILAVPFLIFGVGRIDPAAKTAPWTFRVLLFPGVVAMWPLLIGRWLRSRRAR